VFADWQNDGQNWDTPRFTEGGSVAPVFHWVGLHWTRHSGISRLGVTHFHNISGDSGCIEGQGILTFAS
jgi:hypothetical protein